MSWKVEYEPRALRQLKKLEKRTVEQIRQVMESRVAREENPRNLGKAMTGEWKGLWRFRVGDYRIVCDIRDAELVIVAVQIGHRKDVYDKGC